MMIKILIPSSDISIIRHLNSENPPKILHFKGYEDIPKLAGIYVFRGKRGKRLYIGQSKNLKQRMYSHFSRSSTLQHITEHVYYVEFFVIDDPMEREIYETYMINVWDSKYNTDKKFHGEKGNANVKLRDRYRQKYR